MTRVYPDTNQTINIVGTGITFECEATGIPSPSISWYRNGTELNNITDPRVILHNPSAPTHMMNNDGGVIYSVNRTLTLEMIEDSDSGRYECRATNEAIPGEKRMEFGLIVYSK